MALSHCGIHRKVIHSTFRFFLHEIFQLRATIRQVQSAVAWSTERQRTKMAGKGFDAFLTKISGRQHPGGNRAFCRHLV